MAFLNENDNRYSQRLGDISNKYKKNELEAMLADYKTCYFKHVGLFVTVK